MTTQETLLLGLTGVGSLALVGALVLWRHAVGEYRPRMDDHAALVFTYATPLFMFLTAGPVYDVVIHYAGGPFPVIGAPGVAVGLAGSILTMGYVLLKLPSSEETTESTEGTDATA